MAEVTYYKIDGYGKRVQVTEEFEIDSGSVGIGLSNYVVGNNEQLSVVGNESNSQAVYVSGSAAATSHGLHIRVGPTSPSAGEALYLSFSDILQKLLGFENDIQNSFLHMDLYQIDYLVAD